MFGPAQDGDESRRLLEEPALASDLFLTRPILQNAIGRFMALVEDAGYGAALAPYRRKAIVPVGLARNAVPFHRQHLVEDRKAFFGSDYAP